MSGIGFVGAAPADIRRRPYASGGYFHFDGPGTFNSGGNPGATAGQVRLTPGFLHAPVTVSEFGSGIITVSAAGNFQALLYAADPVTNLPRGAPLIQTGNLSTAAAGIVTQAGLAVKLPPGLYWHGVQADNTVAAFSALPGTCPFVPQIIGIQSGVTFGLGSGGGQCTGLVKAGVFNAPPSPTGVWANDGWSIDTNAIAALALFRAA